jgi:hypothetical protein
LTLHKILKYDKLMQMEIYLQNVIKAGVKLLLQ